MDGVYQRGIALAIEEEKSAGNAANAGDTAELRNEAANTVAQMKLDYVRWLMKNGKNAAAEQVLESIGKKQQSGDYVTLELLLAARQGKLAAAISSYEKDSTTAPALSTLSAVASELRVDGDFANSRTILEYVFEQKLEQQQLQTADYLALAEARLKTNDLPGALDLLQRMTLQGDLYANLDAAARLLTTTGHTAEALPMLTKLANGAPWDENYRLRLGEAQATVKESDAATSLASVAANGNASYSARAEASTALHLQGAAAKDLGSAELTLLAASTATAAQAAQAEQPYFVYARMAAAVPSPQQITLLEGALLAAPEPMREWLRLQIFDAAMASRKYDLANAAIQPVLVSEPWMRQAASEPADNGETAEMNDADATTSAAQDSASADVASMYSLSAALGTDAQKAAFEMRLAEMDEHLGNIDLAVSDLQSALALTKDAAGKKLLSGRVAALKAESVREAQNGSRRPQIKDELQQSVVVRPRLTAQAPARSVP
jgi:transcriptional regulator with XRE-family HTH domain